MESIMLNVGVLGTNCYLAYCPDTLETAVIDPGGSADKILAEIKKKQLKVKYIINTHGHFDHTLANLEIKKAVGVQLLIHEADAEMLESGDKNLSAFFGSSTKCGPADRLLVEGDVIEIGNKQLKVLHTPGHTLGGICLVSANKVFAGDTLFAEGIGRTDFPGGSEQQLVQSIREKLFVLDDEMQVFPGHGPNTTIGWEKKMNPFIR